MKKMFAMGVCMLLLNGLTSNVYAKDNRFEPPVHYYYAETGAYRLDYDMNVRTAPSRTSEVIAIYTAGYTVNIVNVVDNSDGKWGELDTGGWICIAEPSLTYLSVVAEGGVYQLNYDMVKRSEPNRYSANLGIIPQGYCATIFAVDNNSDGRWGMLSDGSWVCIADGSYNYLSLVKEAGCYRLNYDMNLRAEANRYSAVTGSLGAGYSVMLFNVVENSDGKWGMLQDGRWICMSDSTYTYLSSIPDTGIYRTNYEMTLRSGPNRYTAGLGYISAGTSLTILDIDNNSDGKWGLTANGGWVCISDPTIKYLTKL